MCAHLNTTCPILPVSYSGVLVFVLQMLLANGGKRNAAVAGKFEKYPCNAQTSLVGLSALLCQDVNGTGSKSSTKHSQRN